jgi:hypothetical protein
MGNVHLKVEVIAGRTSRGSLVAEDLPGDHDCAVGSGKSFQVSIEERRTAGVKLSVLAETAGAS